MTDLTLTPTSDLQHEIDAAIAARGGTVEFHYDEDTRTWCLAGQNRDGLLWETDDYPAPSRQTAEADAADYLREY